MATKAPVRAASKPAPKATPKLPMPSKDMDIRIRQIENGFVVTKSGMTGTGPKAKYVSTEVFTAKMPKI